ncbi:hypothetical protein FRX31_005692, partial [Thalictrum thalictroides]
MNHALVAKLLWKLLTDKESLWSKVMLAKYGKLLKLKETDSIPNWVSPIFRGLLKVKYIIDAGALWNLGDGRNIEVWTDPWLLVNNKPTPLNLIIHGPFPSSQKLSSVISRAGGWCPDFLNTLPPPVRHQIQMLHPRPGIKDILSWTKTKKGKFSVKSAYWTCKSSHNN